MNIIVPKVNKDNEIDFRVSHLVTLLLLFSFLITSLGTWYYQLKFNSKVLVYMDVEAKDSLKQWGYITILRKERPVKVIHVNQATIWG